MSYVKKFIDFNMLSNPPVWLKYNIMFEGMTGSVAYGVYGESSDIDIVGFCIPPKEMLFPHLSGEIEGFGTPKPRFNVFQQHHIKYNEKEYDISIYSIVKFFQLAMENNPNMVDVLFLPRRCVLHSTPIYEHVRDNRKLFLHKGSWHKFRGYAYSQLSKIETQSNKSNPKRQQSIEEFGYDVKFAYHIVRLLLEVEQILMECDLDIQRNSAILKSIRNGEWNLDRLKEWFSNKEKSMEILYSNSELRSYPDESKIKNVLIECLEIHYGTLSNIINKETDNISIITELQKIIQKLS